MQAPIDRNHGGNKWAAACRQLFLPDSQKTEIFSIFRVHLLAPLSFFQPAQTVNHRPGAARWPVSFWPVFFNFIPSQWTVSYPPFGMCALCRTLQTCFIKQIPHWTFIRFDMHRDESLIHLNIYLKKNIVQITFQFIVTWDKTGKWRHQRTPQESSKVWAYVKCSTLHSRKIEMRGFYDIVNLMNCLVNELACNRSLRWEEW